MNAKLPGVSAPLLGLGAKPLLLAPLEPSQLRRRRRIWEISGNFHCSIIGTCLTTTELRRILVKVELPAVHEETDHELHGRGVLMAGKKAVGSKLLQKALDRRHRSVIERFNKARTATELRALWNAAVERGEIPGAYWAVLTHPEATEELARHIFGEVHMLSHLVGAANRADIRRLRELEAQNAALRETVMRRQRQLRDAVAARDATIANLSDMLGNLLSSPRQDAVAQPASDVERSTTAQLISDLRHRLASEVERRAKADRRLLKAMAEREAERKQRHDLERRVHEMREEVDSAELALAQLLRTTEHADEGPSPDLGGLTLLYVGGRAGHVGQLRKLAEQWSAIFLHHDGGIDDRTGLLEAQVACADRTLFPVDSVSHNAVTIVKRVARSMGKPYMVLRSCGVTSFASALRSIAMSDR
jgi:hypothetical protein